MIENGIMRVGGNTPKVWFWNFIARLGDNLVSIGRSIKASGEQKSLQNRPISVANPSAKLINPFTMLITFTVNVNDKYQLVLQGDYKENYKDSVDGAINLLDEKIFMIINEHQKEWFKKD